MRNNKKISVIIAAAGSGKRMGGGLNKQYIKIGGVPVLARSVQAFQENEAVDEIIITVKTGEEDLCRREIVDAYGFTKVTCILAGGAERQDSVNLALKNLSSDSEYVLIHDGARPFVTQRIINDVIDECIRSKAVIPGIAVKDTIKVVSSDSFVEDTLDRSLLRAVQTPQGFEKSLLEEGYRTVLSTAEGAFTDDASLIEILGYPVSVAEGDESNIKITTPDDVKRGEMIIETLELKKTEADFSEAAAQKDYTVFYGGTVLTDSVSKKSDEIIEERNTENEMYKSGLSVDSYILNLPRTGIGFDVHAFIEGRPLILGGVSIPHHRGLLGHSDADVLLHAIMDALLGAAGLGDIGKHFPDKDAEYNGISSLKLLERVGGLLKEKWFEIVNIDGIVIAQKPKIAPYTEQMKKNISQVLKISMSQINIKGTTSERLGFTGREEGIAAQAVAAIVYSGR